MFDAPLAPVKAPCLGCAQRHRACWSGCAAYAKYRSTLDHMQEERTSQRAVDEAGIARGDKIRRDVRRYGLYGRRRP